MGRLPGILRTAIASAATIGMMGGNVYSLVAVGACPMSKSTVAAMRTCCCGGNCKCGPACRASNPPERQGKNEVPQGEHVLRDLAKLTSPTNCSLVIAAGNGLVVMARSTMSPLDLRLDTLLLQHTLLRV